MIVGWSADAATWLSAAGICWDISGGVLLTKGLVLADGQVRRRAGSYLGSSPPAIRGLCEQRIDARYGLCQLLLGFAMQLVSAVGITASPEVGFLLVFPICFVWHWYLRNFKYWTTMASLRFVESATERVWRVHFQDVPKADWDRIVRRLGIEFKPEKPRASIEPHPAIANTHAAG
ncbi:hypothetical protein GOB46_08995 [Sinorhizobium meliloti]|uniref:hypothetical protein n=1 Tax=Rhizobium meliloti TaxID=382 RepID=UPI00299E82BB|nr:hypothetical protein [Sinorhizobium meliloti]MDW9509979.1 hypothetical protein [Sinorhizobium meliloti]MDW9852721.1 hypothetical protein [Sinorhizobium meliloti]MDW9870915.1 hypothetical protein [Sinorhizobium meliloti]MDW9883896.1 hypothetical protein [Sinorhizobium meliloti]